MMKWQFVALSLLASTTFTALGNFFSAPAATITEREKNNTDTTAQVLPAIIFPSKPAFADHIVKGIIPGGVPFGSDVDFYRVDIGSPRSVMDHLTLNNTGFTTHLYYDENENGRADAAEHVISIKTAPSTLKGMPTGTYFIAVSGTTFVGAPYTLTLRAALSRGSQNEIEPNNTPEQATVVQGFVVGQRALRGVMVEEPGGTGDGEDHYWFSVGTARPMTVEVDNLGSGFLNFYHDKNRNSRIDAGEFLEHRSIQRDLSLTRTLAAGEYIIQLVKPFGSGSATYGFFLREPCDLCSD